MKSIHLDYISIMRRIAVERETQQINGENLENLIIVFVRTLIRILASLHEVISGIVTCNDTHSDKSQ